MSTTTQILFNSPALHSLKRDQLVKLCKIHAIKASGKNIELIEKLKKHAETLPRDSPLSVAARSEGTIIEDRDHKSNDTMDEDQATEPEESTRNGWNFQMPRPSEQWEVVMESIEEIMEDNSSQGTLSSLRTLGGNSGSSGEFGTGMSKSSSVSSSIKALASSFGLKRGNTSKSTLVSSSSFPSTSSSKSSLYPPAAPSKPDELTQHSTPYSSLPASDVPLQTDHFTFDHPHANADNTRPTESQAPLPGHSLRPGVPAPLNARLSLGLNAPATPTRKEATTTIRLISNATSNNVNDGYSRTPQLKPFKTSFDLLLGSPQPNLAGFRGTSLWPNDGSEGKGIYPALPFELPLSPSAAVPTLNSNSMDTEEDVTMPGSLSFAPHPPDLTSPAPTTTTQLTVPQPFIFGSPLPQHNVSNTQFKSAAASVLEEMNKRLKEEGVDVVGVDLISRLQPGAHSQGIEMLGREVKLMPKTAGMKEKFEKMHEEEFSKMEGIDGLIRRRASPKKDSGDRPSGRDSAVAIGKKRKSSVLGHGAGRDRFGRRVGGDSTSGRVSGTRVISNGRRPRVLPGSFDDEDEDEDEEVEEVAKREGKRVRVDSVTASEVDKEQESDQAKEKEEERKRKEKEAIRRKLELNKARRRSSVGVAARGRVSVGRGGVLLKPQPKASRFGFLSSAKSLVQNVWNRGKTAVPSTTAPTAIPKPVSKLQKVVPHSAPVAPKKISSIGTARPSVAVNSSGLGRVPSLREEKENPKGPTGTSSFRARSPLPSFAPVSSSRSSLIKTSRNSSLAGAGVSSKSGGVSSIGTRSSFSSSNKLSAVGSMGSKKILTGSARRASGATASGSSSSRLSSRLSSSRLLAPTASSLAKITRSSTSGFGLKTVAESSGSQSFANAEALGMITNNPALANGPWSPRPGGIFSKPLEAPSGIPTPVKRRVAPSMSGSFSMGGSSSQIEISGTQEAGTSAAQNDATVPTRQRSLAGRKPRISRSKVIAKLASQRAAGANSSSISGKAGGTPSHGGRTRSSLGVKAQRSSFGGRAGGVKGGAGNDVIMSAKKRARQSEYMRRKSRVTPIDFSGGVSGDSMDVDAE